MEDRLRSRRTSTTFSSPYPPSSSSSSPSCPPGAGYQRLAARRTAIDCSQVSEPAGLSSVCPPCPSPLVDLAACVPQS